MVILSAIYNPRKNIDNLTPTENKSSKQWTADLVILYTSRQTGNIINVMNITDYNIKNLVQTITRADSVKHKYNLVFGNHLLA